MKDAGIINQRCKKRPDLTPEHVALQLQFAREHCYEDWPNWSFSNECSVEKGVGKKRLWSFGYPKEKWTKDRLEVYPKGKQASAMVWAIIGITMPSTELILMTHAEDTGGFTQYDYYNALEEGLAYLRRVSTSIR